MSVAIDIFGQAPIYTGIGQAGGMGGWRHGAQQSEPSRLTLEEGRVFYLWFGRQKYIGLV